MDNEIIVVEGADAAGKQTHSKMVASRMNAQRFSFPNYESVTGRAILGHLKKQWKTVETDHHVPTEQPFEYHAQLDALVFQALQTANRLEIMPEIQRAREVGPVVFDRYWQSAVVYGVLDGLGEELAYRIQAGALPKATANVLIDVPVEEGFLRRPERRDRYEADRGLLERVRAGYLRLWGKHSDRDVYGAEAERWIVVDGLGPIDEVQARIEAAIDTVRKKTRTAPPMPTPVSTFTF